MLKHQVLGKHVGLGVVHDCRQLRYLRPDLVGDGAPLRACGLGRFLGEGGGDESGDDAAPALTGMGQHVKWTRHLCQCRAQHLGDGRLDAFMGIGDDELDAAQAATGQLAQELRPDRLGLRGADLHAQHLAPAVRIDADSDDDGDRHDACGRRGAPSGR